MSEDDKLIIKVIRTVMHGLPVEERAFYCRLIGMFYGKYEVENEKI